MTTVRFCLVETEIYGHCPPLKQPFRNVAPVFVAFAPFLQLFRFHTGLLIESESAELPFECGWHGQQIRHRYFIPATVLVLALATRTETMIRRSWQRCFCLDLRL